jgi:nucleoid DNA-binding protein
VIRKVKDLYKVMAEETGLDKKQVKVFFEEYFKLVSSLSEEDQRVILPHMGYFEYRKTDAKMGINPSNGEEVKVPNMLRIKYNISNSLKQKMKKEI